MIRSFRLLAVLPFSIFLVVGASAQNPSPVADGSVSDLVGLTRKIDEQNVKIDLLSQQILHLQQEIEHPKGNSSERTIPTATAVSSPVPADANTHVVTRGETLTSIAKMHKVTIDELQKLNHIENDRKLQIGQTLLLPPAAAAPSPSASSPNE